MNVVGRNLRLFLANNAARINYFNQFATPGARKCFLAVPVFLHFNNSRLPGYIDGVDQPFRLQGFESSIFQGYAQKAFGFDESGKSAFSRLQGMAVDSLLLMGSCASIGHISTSDLDYWVCFDHQAAGQEMTRLLRGKCDAITKWAAERNQCEVNFYFVDPKDVAANRFYSPGKNTEGEAAPLFLKDEFYRTFLLCTGKIPFWVAVPPNATEAQYQRAAAQLCQADSDEARFVDMGYPTTPPPKDYMAAALWLSTKSDADPFKALLKIVLILEQVASGFTVPLLCNIVKNQLFQAGKEDLPVDHYQIMIDRVLVFAQAHLPDDLRRLVQKAALLKIIDPLDAEPPRGDNPKGRYIISLLKDWGWPGEERAASLSYHTWPLKEKIELGKRLKAALQQIYSKIADRLTTDFPELMDQDDRGLFQFKAAVLTRYSDHESRIAMLPSDQIRKNLPQVLTLVNTGPIWTLCAGKVAAWQTADKELIDGCAVDRFSRASQAAAWLVQNRILSKETRVSLLPRPGPVSMEDFLELLRTLAHLFPHDFKGAGENEDQLTMKIKGPRLLIVNLEVPWHEKRLHAADMVYRTVWGEMRYRNIVFDEQAKEIEKIFIIIGLLKETGNFKAEDVHVFGPNNKNGQRIIRNIRAALAQALKKDAKPFVPPSGGRGAAVDLG